MEYAGRSQSCGRCQRSVAPKCSPNEVSRSPIVPKCSPNEVSRSPNPARFPATNMVFIMRRNIFGVVKVGAGTLLLVGQTDHILYLFTTQWLSYSLEAPTVSLNNLHCERRFPGFQI